VDFEVVICEVNLTRLSSRDWGSNPGPGDCKLWGNVIILGSFPGRRHQVDEGASGDHDEVEPSVVAENR